ncbi:hypothetical protein DFJ58DRAFT_733507 [Suillus subalutaceus]|uniref:uncharacterized protein n=1 Tax=Suillus subalutaceus TaxID=48586 RepID=UPI001B88296B|nr:uncharacterized protein DFJ58DRAFT_733507 [Suillus subalutaceus]KAG1839009.1 hypothetical protein DFJ58DRAFT_733507 [Suillus subalutaceus]
MTPNSLPSETSAQTPSSCPSETPPPMTATSFTAPLPNSSPSPVEDENNTNPFIPDSSTSGPSPFEDNNNPLPAEFTHTSSITDVLLDPVLCVLDNSFTAPVEHLPSQPDSPPSSQPQPHTTTSFTPTNQDSLIPMINSSHKQPVNDTAPSKGQCPKCARKLTKKAQQLCSMGSDSRESNKGQRKAKGGQRAK